MIRGYAKSEIWNPCMLHFQKNVNFSILGMLEIEQMLAWTWFLKYYPIKFWMKLMIYPTKKWNNSSRIALNGIILPFMDCERLKASACQILAQKLKNSMSYCRWNISSISQWNKFMINCSKLWKIVTFSTITLYSSFKKEWNL